MGWQASPLEGGVGLVDVVWEKGWVVEETYMKTRLDFLLIQDSISASACIGEWSRDGWWVVDLRCISFHLSTPST